MFHLLFLSLLSCTQTPAGVARIDPPGGAAGTLVTITGSGFTPDMSVELGGAHLTAVEITDEHTMQFRIPELPSGEHALVIVLPDGATTTIPRAFATDTPSP